MEKIDCSSYRRTRRFALGKKTPLLLAALSLCLLLALIGCSSGLSASASPTLTPLEALGETKFRSVCVNCRATTPETVIVGPSLAGVAARAAGRLEGMDAQSYLRDSILNPRNYPVEGFPENLMPTSFGEAFSEDEIDGLVAYLLSLDGK